MQQPQVPAAASDFGASRTPLLIPINIACRNFVSTALIGKIRGAEAAMRRHILMLLAFSFSLAAPTSAWAASLQEQRGKILALYNCAKCHSLDKVSPSPLKTAPPFRTLHTRYPIEALAQALAEGISTGHPRMPPFPLGPDQVGDLLAYLKTLEY
jgi:cytochrome c